MADRGLRTGLIILLLALFLAACRPAADGPAQETPSIPLVECQLTAPGFASSLPARCGSLSVPENYDQPDGRQIALRLAVVPPVSRDPAPDPLFFLTGGPGQAATESYAQISRAFERINQKRAIVLVDQRGTGGSNPLNCPGEQPDPAADLSEAQAAAALDEWLRTCLASLDADPAKYTTGAAVQDLDRVRQALDYQQVNLYGLSYGTRVAQTYLARYPENVRTVILDGVVPQSEVLGPQVARDAQRALDLIFARCQQEEACRQAFPEVSNEFQALLTSLQENPVELTIPHPVRGEPVDLLFSAEKLASAVRLLSYTPETAALLPFLIHTAQAGGDLGPLAAQYLLVTGDLEQTISVGLNFSVLCAEDAPFIDDQEASRLNAGTYLGDLQTEELRQVCERWPHRPVPLDFHTPVQADAPVLILSGEADPVTPPENGEVVAGSLPNGRQIVVPGQGHNVIYRGCLPLLAARFIENSGFDGIDFTCVQEVAPMPFFLDYNGPRP